LVSLRPEGIGSLSRAELHVQKHWSVVLALAVPTHQSNILCLQLGTAHSIHVPAQFRHHGARPDRPCWDRPFGKRAHQDNWTVYYSSRLPQSDSGRFPWLERILKRLLRAPHDCDADCNRAEQQGDRIRSPACQD